MKCLQIKNALYRISRLPAWYSVEYIPESIMEKRKKIKSIYVNDWNRNIIERIFFYYLDNLSARDISRKFNDEGTKKFPK